MNHEQVDVKALDFQKAGMEITYDEAAKKIKDHCDVHSIDEPLSFVVNKDMLLKILTQPGCVGLRIMNAIHDGRESVAFAGVDSNGDTMMKITSVNDAGKLATGEASFATATIVAGIIKPLGWLD